MSAPLFHRVFARLLGRPILLRRAAQGLTAQMFDLADRIDRYDRALGDELREIVGALAATEVTSS